MSRNLVKTGYIQAGDKRVIDTNTLVSQRIEALSAKLRLPENDGFAAGLLAEQIEVEALTRDDEGAEDYEGFQSGIIKAVDPEELLGNAQAEADSILAQAQDEANEMMARAQSEIAAERAAALAEAKKQGYEEGKVQALREIEEMKAGLIRQKAQLEADYEETLAALEPAFIDQLSDIYAHIFNVDLGSHKEILMFLIGNAIRQADSCKSFLVRVSKTDYPYVKEQRALLLEAVPYEDSTLDVVEDVMLSENQCMIETDNGIFDCGLGTQLEELTKKLKLLSYRR